MHVKGLGDDNDGGGGRRRRRKNRRRLLRMRMVMRIMVMTRRMVMMKVRRRMGMEMMVMVRRMVVMRRMEVAIMMMVAAGPPLSTHIPVPLPVCLQNNSTIRQVLNLHLTDAETETQNVSVAA